MSITLAEARPAEAHGAPERLSFKTAETAETVGGQALSMDEAEGIVTAIVSVTGVVDEVDDIIVPGAYRETLMKRRPKVCWAHSWEHPIGKVLEIEELLPGDKRLPTMTRDHKPWPKDAGALVAKMQFNMRTDEGKNAFEVVRFYSESGECEYSIGYNVPPGRASDVKGIRMIKMLELYELSVVLFGAHTMTGTLDFKSIDIKGLGLAASAIRTTGKGVDLDALSVKAPVPPQFQKPAGETDKPAAGGAAAKPKVEDIDPAAETDSKPEPADGDKCTCCAGTGEHEDGHECYVCDAAGTLEAQKAADDPALQPGDPIVCAGHHGRPDEDPDVDHGVDPISPDAAPEGTPVVEGKATDAEPVEGEEPPAEGGEGDQGANGDPADPAADPGPTDATRPPTGAADRSAPNTAEPGASGEDSGGDVVEASDSNPDFSDGIMVAAYPDPAAADAIAAHIAGPDATTPREDLHITLAYLGKIGGSLLSEQGLIDAVTRAVEGQVVLNGEVGGIGQFPPGEDGTPTYAPVDVPGINLLREQIVSELGDAVYNDHGFTPHMTLGYDIGLVDPVPPTPIRIDHVRVVYGNSQRHITLGAPLPESKSAEPDEMRDALAGYAALDEAGKVEAKARIIQMARASGRTNLLPESWAVDSKGYRPSLDRSRLDASVEAKSIEDVMKALGWEKVEVKAEGGADRNRGGAEQLRDYWLHGEGAAKIAWGTPGDFTRCVGFLSEHMTEERAKGYCANRHKDATGMWPGDRDNKDVSVMATESKDVPLPAGAKSYPQMPGSYEERTQDVHNALCMQYEDDVDENGYPNMWINVRATWSDRVLYGVEDRHEFNDNANYYLAGYVIDDDGAIEFTSREDVDLMIVPVLVEHEDDDETDEEWSVLDAYPFAEGVMAVASAFKSGLAQAAEMKAGRVLSGANERALRTAFEHLVNVLAAAGIDLGEATPEGVAPQPNDGSDGDQRREMDQRVDTTTTEPLATTKGLPEPEAKNLGGGESQTIDWDAHRRLLADIEAETAE